MCDIGTLEHSIQFDPAPPRLMAETLRRDQLVSQSDYLGHDEPNNFPLVPRSLTVYRHFALEGEKSKPIGIKPMGQTFSSGSSIYPYENMYTASCNASSSRTSAHKSPDVKCQCGFYASYDPDTDFYAYVTDPRVFAATEAFGHVVMATKGVRAEKMRIKGMWIQPKVKQVHVEDMTELRNARKNEDWFPHSWIVYDAVTSSMRMRAAPVGFRLRKVICDGIDEPWLGRAVEAASVDYDVARTRIENLPEDVIDLSLLEQYKVPIYATREELLEKNPPEDVSSLLNSSAPNE